MNFACMLLALSVAISSEIIFLSLNDVILNNVSHLALMTCHLIFVTVRNRSIFSLLNVMMIALS